MAGYNYYDGDASNVPGGGPNGNPSVIFINGNLNINYDLTLAAGDTAIFVVRGNITVATSVTRIDGVYVAGGMNPDGTPIPNGGFRDTTDDASTFGNQLVIYGA